MCGLHREVSVTVLREDRSELVAVWIMKYRDDSIYFTGLRALEGYSATWETFTESQACDGSGILRAVIKPPPQGQSGQQAIQSPPWILLNNPGCVHVGPTDPILQTEQKVFILPQPNANFVFWLTSLCRHCTLALLLPYSCMPISPSTITGLSSQIASL